MPFTSKFNPHQHGSEKFRDRMEVTRKNNLQVQDEPPWHEDGKEQKIKCH
jgi:hypothetical protein